MEQVARQGKAASIDMVTDAVIEPSTPSYEDYDPEDTGGDGVENDLDETSNPEDRIGIKHVSEHDLKKKFKYHLVTMIKTVTVTDTRPTRRPPPAPKRFSFRNARQQFSPFHFARKPTDDRQPSLTTLETFRSMALKTKKIFSSQVIHNLIKSVYVLTGSPI